MAEHTHQEGKYELHLTFDQPKELRGWKSSAIAGDPLLGPGVKHYLTTYAASESMGRDKICSAIVELGEENLLRAKIEHIVFDVRFDS